MPRVAGSGAFVETGHRSGEFNRGEVVLSNKIVQRLGESASFLDSSLFSFVSDDDFGKVGERREMLFFAFLDEIAVKAEIVGVCGEADDGGSGLVGLDKNGGGVEMPATDASDDLRDEFEGFFLGGEVGEGKTGVGLNDTDGSEVGKIETAGDGLSADDDSNVAVFNFVIESIKRVVLFVIGVKAGDGDFGEEFFKFGF